MPCFGRFMSKPLGDKPPIVVIGGGASGIVAAYRAATLGASVTLLERTNRLGTKILISGGGKCNITHSGPIESILKAFRPHEAAFLRPSFYRFRPEQIVEMLESKGIDTYVRPDGRVFPTHLIAKDVANALADYLEEAKVNVRFLSAVHRFERSSDGFLLRLKDEEEMEARQVVLCAGGSSYPNSGTTGDGWRWAEALGLPLVPRRAALAPITLCEDPAEGMAGVALRDIVLKARQNKKEIDRWRGDLLFTHHGVSGPCTLAVSRVVAERLDEGPVTLEVDLAASESFESLSADWIERAKTEPRKTLLKALAPLGPERIGYAVLENAGLDPSMMLKDLPKKERNRLIETIKMFPVGQVREPVLLKGEVVAGGVSLESVDPQSMRVPAIPGLYIAGEVLDIAGPVGGYNLQAAWSTGWVAGESAAKDWLEQD